MLLALFWFFSSLAVALGVSSLAAGRRHAKAIEAALQAAALKEATPGWTPKATLIVPVKGLEPGLRENLCSLLNQDYPDYELLIVARDDGDLALDVTRPLLGRPRLDQPWLDQPGRDQLMPGSRARLIIAGSGPSDTSEKINNLLAAVAAARPESEVLAFADSDGLVSQGWLRALIAPLENPSVGAVTGYRWYFPENGGFWPLVRSVWNSTIAGTFGGGPPPFAWGGAMAVRAETFRNARIAEYWRGSVSDDYRLTQAIRAAGLAIVYSPRAMVASSGVASPGASGEECSAGEFLRWAVRQLTITRVYGPKLFWPTLAAHVVYCGAMATGLVMIGKGGLWATPLLLLAVGPGMWRGRWREQTARLLFPERSAWFSRHGWAYFWLAPFVTWVWLYVLLASLFRRRIEWRGNTYELLSPSKTVLVK